MFEIDIKCYFLEQILKIISYEVVSNTEVHVSYYNLHTKTTFSGITAYSITLFTPTFKYFYTDISAISVTFRNSDNTCVLYTVQPTVTRNRSSPWESPEETLMAWTNTELASPPRPWSQNLLLPEGLNILCIMCYTVTRQQSLKPFIDHQNKHFWLEQILMVRVPVSPAHRVSTVGFYIFLRLHNCVPVICVLLWEQCSLLRASPDVVSTIFHIWVFEEFSIC